VSLWVLSHSRGFIQLCHIYEFDHRHKKMPDWVYASDQRALWNRQHIRDDRPDVLWTTVHRKELRVSDTSDTWYNTHNRNRIWSEHDMCIPGG
jgi:hypothetical protein